MENILLKGFILFVLIIALDSIWFSQMKGFYHSQSGTALKAPNYYAAAATYLLLVFGIMYFTTQTALQNTVTTGALFGLVVYGIYNLTNLTTIAHWTPRLALVDTLWGTIACSILSSAKFLLR